MCDDDPRAIVQNAYDNISKWYLDWVGNQSCPREKYIRTLLEETPTASPSILELGCGPGVPALRMLLDHGAKVTGNDISVQQLRLAKARCPEAKFVSGDMSLLSFNHGSFDGVVCLYTLFHLPRAEQKAMLQKIHSWLKPGGVFVCNFAAVDEEAIHGEFLGHGMFWSSFGVEANQMMLKEVGFDVVMSEVSGVAGDEDDFDAGVEFLWVVAKKGMTGGAGFGAESVGQ